jgi:uncharacterized damage-inducible protein DinB
MSLKDLLLAEWDHEIASARRMLERLPDDRLGWQPHPKSMTLGGLGTHMANLPTWGPTILDAATFDLANVPPKREPLSSRADILALFDASTGRLRAMLDRSDAEWLAPWTLRRNGQEMFTAPRWMAFRSWILNHLVHHRGQLSVFLRLIDVPVPAVYGPTADEG